MVMLPFSAKYLQYKMLQWYGHVKITTEDGWPNIGRL